jgi:hypothetical protein
VPGRGCFSRLSHWNNPGHPLRRFTEELAELGEALVARVAPGFLSEAADLFALMNSECNSLDQAIS